MRPINYMVRSLSGTKNRLELVSPYLFNQRKFLNHHFLASVANLPIVGLVSRARVFDFGFNAVAASLPAFGSNDVNLVIRKNMLVWGMTGVAHVIGAATPSPAFLFNVTQTHENTQTQWFNKAISDVEGLGSAQHPYLLRRPQLVIAGDSLDVEVQNLNGVTLQAQVVFFGGEFE